MRKAYLILIVLMLIFGTFFVNASTNIPPEIQGPGTQPGEVRNLESPDNCNNCHGGYNRSVEPGYNWNGGMMAQAARDPLFWATLSVAEQDFNGIGYLCFRCHTQIGWLEGRSIPTNGSALTINDADGVVCDLCHRMTNPDNSEHIGVQNIPFIANNKDTNGNNSPIGYYGSGMFVIKDLESNIFTWPKISQISWFANINLIIQIAGFFILFSGVLYARRKNFIKHIKITKIAVILGVISLIWMSYSLFSDFLIFINSNFNLLIIFHVIIGLLAICLGILFVYNKNKKKRYMNIAYFSWILALFLGIILYGYLVGGTEKLGPYSDAMARHQFSKSKFHFSAEICGTCHDPSNPVVGDLANNSGKLPNSDPVIHNGILGSPINEKAAFNNFPYQYGIIERTYSEHKSSLLSTTPVSDYNNLPINLQSGALKATYESSILAGTGGNYSDGTIRYFNCQTCHMRPVIGKGANMYGVIERKDLPLHDLTGGNYWVPDTIKYLDSKNNLRLGGGFSKVQIEALDDGKIRAKKQLREAASLSVKNNTLKVINTAGHKLITGYPEGRRMWLNIKWYDNKGIILREDGKYGKLAINMQSLPSQIDTILDLNDSNTKIYETSYAITQEWAAKLISLGYNSNLPLSYNRTTGVVNYTLGQLASQKPGTYSETFHLISNYVARDNRIPPYGMSYDEARIRNALPVPEIQYGNPGPGGMYNYWDEILLNPPSGAQYASIDLLYQPTSWEYIQFLYLANNRKDPFLADEGVNIMEAWLNTDMAAPYIMASSTWKASSS